MHFELTESIEIPKHPGQVYAYLTDFSRRGEYIPQLERVEILDPGPVDVGTRYVEHAKIAGRNLKTTYQVIDLQDQRKISIASIRSIFPIRVDLRLHPENAGTFLTATLRYRLKGLYVVAAPMIEGLIKQQLSLILINLRMNLEKQN